MTVERRAGNCHWAIPTLFLPMPLWLDAGARPWTCARDTAPRPLDTTERCAVCPHWAPRPNAGRTDTTCLRRASAVPMLDWFGAFATPHETRGEH